MQLLAPSLSLTDSSEEPVEQPPHSTSPNSPCIQKKRSNQKRPSAYPCQHTLCNSGQYGNIKKIYTSSSKRNNHEQYHKGHNCLENDGTCTTCTNLEEHSNWKHARPEQQFACRHTNCVLKFASISARSHHEVQINQHASDECSTACKQCLKVTKNKACQAEKEERKHTCSAPTCQHPISEELKRRALFFNCVPIYEISQMLLRSQKVMVMSNILIY